MIIIIINVNILAYEKSLFDAMLELQLSWVFRYIFRKVHVSEAEEGLTVPPKSQY